MHPSPHCAGRQEPFGFSFFQLALRGKFRDDTEYTLDIYKYATKDVDVCRIHDFIQAAGTRPRLWRCPGVVSSSEWVDG